MNPAVLLAAGAAVGAPTRYLVDVGARAWLGPRWPWGTLIVNLVGSFVLGVVLSAGRGAPSYDAVLLLGTGFCGALTTFSTFALEVVTLGETGRGRAAVAYAAGSVAAGLALAALGWVVGGVA